MAFSRQRKPCLHSPIEEKVNVRSLEGTNGNYILTLVAFLLVVTTFIYNRTFDDKEQKTTEYTTNQIPDLVLNSPDPHGRSGQTFGRSNSIAHQRMLKPPKVIIPPPEFRPIPSFNKSKCPSTTILNGQCKHANNKLPCVHLPTPGEDQHNCQRPCGSFGLKLRGAGGVFIREGLLMPLYGGAPFGGGLDESFIVSEGWALGTVQNNAKMDKFDTRDAIFLTILRHPMSRILSRYWYEGRWDMGKNKKDISESTAKPLSNWIAQVSLGERNAKPPARLWSCVSNYYVKTFAGWFGKDLCDEHTDATCIEGVGAKELSLAKANLESKFHVVLITEWLSHPAQIEWLGKVFCFPTRPLATRLHKKLGPITFPNFMRKSAPGGNSKHRPINWKPSEEAVREIRRLNMLDEELYFWAVSRVRAILSNLNQTRGPFLALPDITPAGI